MLTLKKTIVPLMSAFIASTAMVSFAQAEDPCGSDGSGDKQSLHVLKQTQQLRLTHRLMPPKQWWAILTVTNR